MGLVVSDDGWRIPDDVGGDGAAVAAAACASARLPQPARARSRRDECDPLCAADWLSVNALDATGICSCSSAYRRFREWEEAGVFLEFWRRGLLAYDKRQGIDWEWLAADGQMAKSPLGGERSGPNPTDRAKRGVKRSLLCEGAGVPIGIEVAGANVRDEKLLRATIESIPIERPDELGLECGLCLDKGYDYSEVYELLAEFGFTAHVRSRREEADAIRHEAGFRAHRWVVERTHSWLNRFRRLLVRWEKRACTYIAMLHLACGLITWREARKNALPK